MQQQVAKPITVVTGASEGIGLALARRFARAGRHVALVAKRPEALAAAARQIDSGGGDVVDIVMDVAAPEGPGALIAELTRRGYVIDTLVNNAGVGLAGAFDGQDAVAIEQMLQLNVTALTRLMRQVLPGMRARGGGTVLNVASLGGYAPGPFQAAYYASKAYVIALSEAVDREMAGSGVRVAVLAPGPVRTRFHARMGTEDALYRWVIPSMSADRVASAAFWGLRLGRRVIVPGVIWPAMALAMRALPHMFTLPLMGWLLRPRTSEGVGNAGGESGR